MQRLRDERDDDSGDRGQSQTRRQAAQERAARERAERVEAALENLVELQQQKEQRRKGTKDKAGCSTTDPEARSMNMGDGGFRPAYNVPATVSERDCLAGRRELQPTHRSRGPENVQFATDGDSRLIVSVDVTNNGSDGGQLAPLHDDVCQRYQRVPDNYTVDGGFATIDDITQVERRGSRVAAPMNSADRIEQRGGDPYAARARDTAEMIAFRQRMKTDEAKAVLKRRPSIAEFPNAECRNRGLARAKTISLWYAVTFNFLRMRHLGILG